MNAMYTWRCIRVNDILAPVTMIRWKCQRYKRLISRMEVTTDDKLSKLQINLNQDVTHVF